MSPIKILHASDLHISQVEKTRSPKDAWYDVNKRFSLESIQKMFESIGGVRNYYKARRAPASSYQSSILEKFAGFAYENSKKFDAAGAVTGGCLDAVVLTGDLATTGTENDINLVRRFLQAPSTEYPFYLNDENGDGTLGALQIPVGFLPGNHDRFEPTLESAWSAPGANPGRFYNPGGTNFDTYLKDFRGSPVQMMDRLESPLPDGRVLTAYIFLADMTLRQFDDHDDWGGGWMGQGKAHQEVCDELADRTIKLRKELPDNEVPAFIWACHFPPKFPGVKDNCRLVEDYVFLKAAKRARIDAVLAGHTHRQLEYRRLFVKFDIFCCGTTTQYEPTTHPGGRHAADNRRGNFIQILTIDEDRGKIKITTDPFRYFHNASGRPDKDPVCPGMGGNKLPWKRIGRETVRYRWGGELFRFLGRRGKIASFPTK
jgi:3',5'-cyclic AMP phosphodiesterase CpdA